MESKVVIPTQGQKITVDASGKLQVPHNPIIPFIEGDGIGVDVTPAMLNVVNAAVEKAYKGERKIAWMEIYTGEKSTHVYGEGAWLPAETLDFIREYCVAIKGPLTTRSAAVFAPSTWPCARSWISTSACARSVTTKGPRARSSTPS